MRVDLSNVECSKNLNGVVRLIEHVECRNIVVFPRKICENGRVIMRLWIGFEWVLNGFRLEREFS